MFAFFSSSLISILLLFLIPQSKSSLIINRKNVIASSAISSIIDSFIQEKEYSKSVNVYIFEESRNIDIFMDILRRVLAKTNNSLTIQMKKYENPYTILYPEEIIVVFCDKESKIYSAPYSKSDTRSRGFMLKYYGHDSKISDSELLGDFEEFKLIHDRKTENLLLYNLMLLENKCETQPNVMNVFQSRTLKWKKRFFKRITKKFNKCPLTVTNYQRFIVAPLSDYSVLIITFFCQRHDFDLKVYPVEGNIHQNNSTVIASDMTINPS